MGEGIFALGFADGGESAYMYFIFWRRGRRVRSRLAHWDEHGMATSKRLRSTAISGAGKHNSEYPLIVTNKVAFYLPLPKFFIYRLLIL